MPPDSLLSTAQLDEILANRELIKAFEGSQMPIAAFAKKYGVSRNKIYRLKQKAAISQTALADARHRNPGRPPKINQRVLAWIFSCRAEFPGMKLTQLREKLAEACERNHIPCPSYSQIRRIVLSAPKDLQSFLSKSYDDFYEDDCLKARRQYGYPMELIQMDSTQLDIYVMDDISGELYKPWLTAGIDMFSKVIPGYFLHREAPSERTSLATLRRIVLPSGRDDQPFYGLTEKITVDRAGSNIAHNLKHQMVHLGINYVANDPRCSDQNGGIERWFRTIQEGLLATLPGYTKQPDGMARAKRGCLNFIMLEKQIEKWLLKYHMAVHSSIKCPPWNKWMDNLDAAHGQILDLPAIKSALRLSHESKVLTDGVHLPDGRIFSGAQLTGLVGERVVVLYDPESPEHEVEAFHNRTSIGKIRDVTCDPTLAKEINATRLSRTKEFRVFRKRLSKIIAKAPLPEAADIKRVRTGGATSGKSRLSTLTSVDGSSTFKPLEED